MWWIKAAYYFSLMQIVFSLFVSQLQGLEKPSQPAFKHSFQLLEVCPCVHVYLKTRKFGGEAGLLFQQQN